MNETKSITCRVCLLLQDKEKFVSLYEQLHNATISEHIMSVALINICQEDGLPDYLCPGCLLKLQVVIDFKKRCQDTDRFLRNIPIEDGVSHEIFLIKKEEIKPTDEEEYLDDYDGFQNSPDDAILSVVAKFESEELPDNYIPLQDPDNILIPKPAKGQLFSPQCNECLKYFSSKCKIRVHLKKEHVELYNTQLPCQFCKRIFKSFKAYNKHKNMKNCPGFKSIADEFVILGEGKQRKFKCKSCEYITDRFIHMNTHVVIHKPGERPFKCKHCSCTYTQRGSLSSHMKEKHFSTPVICFVCGKDLKSNRKLYRHMLRHQEATVPCTLCGRKFKTKKSLACHMLRHKGVKTYQCEVCPSSFFTNSEMCNHRRLVHVRKMIKCSQCDYETLRKEAMIKHERLHGGSKSFPCILCGRFYESLQRLQIHRTKYHKPKSYNCRLCNKSYCSAKSRRYHEKRIHKVPAMKLPQSGKAPTALANIKTKCEPVEIEVSSNDSLSD